MKKIAIIGGGINGIAILLLSSSGYQVDLYEKNKCLEQTSSKSTKLLHGAWYLSMAIYFKFITHYRIESGGLIMLQIYQDY